MNTKIWGVSKLTEELQLAAEPESDLLTAECCRRLVDGPPDDQYWDESADVVVEAADAADRNVGDCGSDWYPNVAADAIYNRFIQTEIVLLSAEQEKW